MRFASALFSGLYSFTTRVSAHFQHHSALVFVYSAISATVLSGAYVLVTNPNRTGVFLILGFAVIDAVAYLGVSVTRVDALKEIDSTIYFPIYKLASSMLVVPIGVLVFADVLTPLEFLGIIIGLLAPILLINKKEHALQRNLSKGLLLTAGSVLGAVIATMVGKSIITFGLDVSMYTFFVFALCVPFAVFLYKRTSGRVHKTKHVEWVGLLGGLFMFGNLYFFVRALTGDLGTVFVINSFSTVLVVVLSVVTFREHLSFKKVGALVVTVVSLILLSR